MTLTQRTGFVKGNPVEHWHSIDTLNAGPVAPQAAPISLNLNAGVCYYIPLMVRETVTVKKLWVACSGTGGTNLDIGLYDAVGTRLVSSGSTAHPASATEFVYDCTDTLISRGIYYFAILSLDATGYFYGVDLGDAYANALGVWVQSSLSSLPATATFAASAFNNIIISGILTNTVVS